MADSGSVVCYSDQGAMSSRKHGGLGRKKQALVGCMNGDDVWERVRRSADCSAQEMSHMIEQDLGEMVWLLLWMVD